MIYLLPLFLLVEWHRIHLNAPRRGLALTAFLLPVVVLSGGWHLHLYLAHDHQITWTNISGYNLQRAWEDFDPEIRAVPHLDKLPRNGELWADLNTSPRSTSRSEELKRMIIGKILENPADAAAHVVDRLATFVSSPTKIYGHDPQGLGIEIYRKLMSALVLLLPAYVVASTISLLRRRQWPWLDRRWWLAVSTLLIALLVTLGEQGEEARFLFTILPMLLAVAGFAIDGLTQKLRAREPPCPLRQRRTRLRLVLRTNCKLAVRALIAACVRPPRAATGTDGSLLLRRTQPRPAPLELAHRPSGTCGGPAGAKARSTDRIQPPAQPPASSRGSHGFAGCLRPSAAPGCGID